MRASVVLLVAIVGCRGSSPGSGSGSGSGSASTSTSTSTSTSASTSGSASTVASTSSPPSTSPSAADASGVDYVNYTNAKFSFSVDVPSFFVKGPADGDGRGQPWSWKGKVNMRAWGMYNVPVMTKDALVGDWTRRNGVLTKETGDNWWIVTAKDSPTKLWYSKSYLDGGVITTAEVSYDVSLKDELAPILEHIGSSLKPGHKK